MLECVYDLLSAPEARWVTAWRQCRHRRIDCFKTSDRSRLWHRVPLNPVITKSFSLRLHRFLRILCPDFFGCTASSYPNARSRSFRSCSRSFVRLCSCSRSFPLGRSRCTSTYNFVPFYAISVTFVLLTDHFSSGYVHTSHSGPRHIK